MEKLIIAGQVPAKKNARRPYVRGNRIMNFPSKIYMAWEKDALKQLRGRETPLEDITISYVFFCADLRARDLDNMIASVNDMLVKKGIIVGDHWQTLQLGSARGELDRENPRVEIVINQTPKTVERST